MTQLEFPTRETSNDEMFSGIDEKIVQMFMEYHTENPGVFLLFRRFAYELWQSGRKNYGGMFDGRRKQKGGEL